MLTRFPRLSARYWRCAATLLLALTASLASAAPRTVAEPGAGLARYWSKKLTVKPLYVSGCSVTA